MTIANTNDAASQPSQSTADTSTNKPGTGPLSALSSLSQIQKYEAEPLERRYPWSNTYELMLRAEQEFGDDTAITFLLTGLPDEPVFDISYRQLVAKITQTANVLNSLGITPEDSTSVLLPNLPHTHFALLGAQAAGIVNPINPLLEPDHIVEIINTTASKVLIALAPSPHADLWDKVEQIVTQTPTLETVLAVTIPGITASAQELPKTIGDTGINVVDFAGALEQQVDNQLLSGRMIQRDDTAAYFHTGGTTGRPKIAKVTHGNLAFITQYNKDASVNLGRCTALAGLPLFHIFGVVILGISAFCTGRKLVMLTPSGYRNPNVIQHFWKHIARFQAEAFAAVPTVLTALMQVPVEDSDISCLMEVGCGASILPTDVKLGFQEKYQVTVVEGYGMTESAGLISRSSIEAPAPNGSVGFRLPYTHVRIAHVEDSRVVSDCEVGETGALLIKGPHVFAGYLDEADNDSAWVDSQWFNTGDLGYIDEAGNIFLNGRMKDVVIRGGHNIDPALIEEPLGRHPDIALAAVVGQPDAHSGELPVAYVTLNANSTISAEHLQRYCQQEISERAAIPKRIEIVDEMPLTAVGKVFKPALRRSATHTAFKNALTEANIDAQITVELDAQRGMIAYVTLVDHADQQRVAERLQGLPVHFEFSPLKSSQ